MIQDILQKSKETKSLIEFNSYGSDNDFFCGYVIDYNTEFAIIQHFSKFGVNDGFLIQKIEDIKYFETETSYLYGLKLLIQSQEKIQKPSYIPNRKNMLEDFNTLFETLIGDKERLIKFELADGDIYFGFLEWCDESNFSIININNNGLNIGKATFKFEDIKTYWIDDLECRRRQLIHFGQNASR